MTNSIFSSPSHFSLAFNQGLVEMLNHDSLGTLILGCANATFDPFIFEATHSALRTQFRKLEKLFLADFRQGRQVNESDEDLLVFLKMLVVGFDELAQTAFRHEDEWEIQFNQVRAFRPRRMSGQVAGGIYAPFNDNGFHFNKTFMQKECFWEGDLNGRPASLYYNKYPFIDYHGVLLPERQKNLSQFLHEEYHRYIWQLAEQLGEKLPGLGYGYNSCGAHASVNHLHFQMFLRPQGLPVMASHWHHNGGNKPYPAQCEKLNDCSQAWSYIDNLHQVQIPYNLIYLPGEILIFPRKRQGDYQQASWSGGFSWYEMGGGTITFNRQAYDELDAEDIIDEFAKLRLQPKSCVAAPEQV
ncbi:hypothetical protein MNBD_GAMMA24-1455 [hydrothermal vent metagenome]|uniref:GDPGP1-like N-terminal domain-containing protein n=1 Tax=hydrothermal vent metagenome TaxID=652676 RepID=A0A3B1BD28_9ZZZZ